MCFNFARCHDVAVIAQEEISAAEGREVALRAESQSKSYVSSFVMGSLGLGLKPISTSRCGTEGRRNCAGSRVGGQQERHLDFTSEAPGRDGGGGGAWGIIAKFQSLKLLHHPHISAYLDCRQVRRSTVRPMDSNGPEKARFPLLSLDAHCS